MTLRALRRGPLITPPTPYRAKRRRSRRGQALVEFALVLPLLLGLIFGLVELALIYGATALYNVAALEAARKLALAGATTGQIDTQTIDATLGLVHPYFVAKVQEIDIYQANASGAMPAGTPENAFDANGNPLATQTFPVASRRGAPDAPLYLGVKITFEYTWFTSFVGSTGAVLTLQATAVTPINQ